jgi:ribosome biogenesis GTPase A
MTQQASGSPVFPEQIARYIDVAAYVLDSRAPNSCMWLDDKLVGRECFILSRADLADERVTARWVKHFETAGYPAFAVDAVRRDGIGDFERFLAKVHDAKSLDRSARGILKTALRVVVLGVPNVGKSTFLNAILGARKLRTGDQPGITRGYQWVRVMKGVDLLDTPGIIRETAQFRRSRAVWLALNLMPVDEQLLESAVERLIASLTSHARKRAEKYYKFELPWDKSAEEVAVKVAMIKRLFVGKGVPDVSRAYRLILRDFQRGRFGRISLETPELDPVTSPLFGRGEG